MWIVRLALRRPYTFAVMALLMLVLGIGSIIAMRKDIFPFIDIPVVSVVWSYTGMPPQEMADRIVTIDERAMTTTVNDIEHMESTSYPGISVIKVYLQPGSKVETAIAEITALSQTILRPLPPGIFAPNILQYDASSVPIIQLAIKSDTLSQQELYDQGQNFIRTQLATIQGASIQLPLGGATPQVMVDLDPASLYARGLSATDVSNALAAQNLIVPAGTAKIGTREYQVQLNSSPLKVEGLNALPIKLSNGSLVYMRDVAQVKLGHAVQTNIVRQDGKHGVLLTIVKHGETSTLDIVSDIKKKLATIGADMPKGLHVEQLFDQSVFVRAAINGVLREGAIAALLTGLMILLFLGSWRSTLIVFVTIPLSILTSLGVLALLGQTINIMTLGGLSLAVGVLVDDATVEVENTYRNLDHKKPLTRAILDGAQQIAVPALVSTLSICIVFVPVLLLTGVAKYLFTPLAGAVVFAMATSYLLSRTIIPTMIRFLLPKELEQKENADRQSDRSSRPRGRGARIVAFFSGIHERFEKRFEAMRERYKGALAWALDHRGWVLIPFLIFVLLSSALVPFIGRDFFPYVDSGQLRLHVRAPAGLRIEETEQVFAAIEKEIRTRIPPSELQTILDDIGLPTGSLNLATGDIATLGSSDGEILISLKPDHQPSQDYERDLRRDLAEHFPDETFFFQAANITNQILNFGLPAPIDVQVTGREKEKNLEVARRMLDEIRRIPGAVDVHLGQETDTPTMGVDVDRDKAQMAGLTQKDVANSVLISLASTSQVAPTQWLDQENGVSYQIAVQTPQIRIDSLDALRRTPITASGNSGNTSAAPQLLGNLATMKRTTSTAAVSHYNVQPVYDIYASTDRRDLGGVASEIDKIVARYKDQVPKGTMITTRGQVDTMNKSFLRLELGLVFAILFVYLLIVVNFQSWMDPLIMLAAVPGALSGVLWMLFLTMTTFSVPSLMGSIMAIGVATSNTILMIVFAEDERRPKKDETGEDEARHEGEGADARKEAPRPAKEEGKPELKSARDAALAAGYTRMRPVIMTALAMVLGMLPMALGLGEGGEQNAPLGRAVIGGLLVATVGTLFIVPVLYAWLRKEPPRDRDREVEDEYHQAEERQPDGTQAA